MDSTAAVIAHEELSAADPGAQSTEHREKISAEQHFHDISSFLAAFCLSFLAHSMLFANNLNLNGSEEANPPFLPPVPS